MPEGKWLVYDLGGGTFDVALETEHGELKSGSRRRQFPWRRGLRFVNR